MSHLEARNLSVSLGGREILHRIDLVVPPGSFVGLIGPNGAGKSTLMRALAGLVAFSGEVRVGDRSLDGLRGTARAREVAYMAQTRDVAWPMSVEDVIALGRLPHRPPFTGPSQRDRDVIDRVVTELDLAGLRARRATELSGGETARVMTARVLAQDTDIIIADEPTAGLDPAHQLNLMKIFSDLSDKGRTVIVSLHELGLAARWCRRLVLLDQGRIRADAAPEEVLTAENLKSVYHIDAFVGRDAGGLLLVPTGVSR
jgi:iron complex transport system ATP-binding protein